MITLLIFIEWVHDIFQKAGIWIRKGKVKPLNSAESRPDLNSERLELRIEIDQENKDYFETGRLTVLCLRSLSFKMRGVICIPEQSWLFHSMRNSSIIFSICLIVNRNASKTKVRTLVEDALEKLYAVNNITHPPNFIELLTPVREYAGS
jgi:hypothetical protein